MPPVPKAIRLRPTNDRTLKWRGENANHVDLNAPVEMDYIAAEGKKCVQGQRFPSHFYPMGTFHLPLLLGGIHGHLPYL